MEACAKPYYTTTIYPPPEFEICRCSPAKTNNWEYKKVRYGLDFVQIWVINSEYHVWPVENTNYKTRKLQNAQITKRANYTTRKFGQLRISKICAAFLNFSQTRFLRRRKMIVGTDVFWWFSKSLKNHCTSVTFWTLIVQFLTLWKFEFWNMSKNVTGLQ